jgi:hypothetical protein
MPVEWYYQKDGVEKGPIPSTQLKEFVLDGVILSNTPVRRISGLATSIWVRAGDVQGLLGHFRALQYLRVSMASLVLLSISKSRPNC